MRVFFLLLIASFVARPAWAGCGKVKQSNGTGGRVATVLAELGPTVSVVFIHQETPSVGPDGTTADTWVDLRFATRSLPSQLPEKHSLTLGLSSGATVTLPAVATYVPSVTGTTTGNAHSATTEVVTNQRAMYTVSPDDAAQLSSSDILSAELLVADKGRLVQLPLDGRAATRATEAFACVLGTQDTRR